MEWRSFSGDVIKQPLLEKVEEIIQREKNLGYKLKVCVGTDSRVCVEKIEFAAAGNLGEGFHLVFMGFSWTIRCFEPVPSFFRSVTLILPRPLSFSK